MVHTAFVALHVARDLPVLLSSLLSTYRKQARRQLACTPVVSYSLKHSSKANILTISTVFNADIHPHVLLHPLRTFIVRNTLRFTAILTWPAVLNDG